MVPGSPEFLRARKNASRRVRYAVTAGWIPNIRFLACFDCGDKATGYDHRDYSLSVNVVPVCRRCNHRRGPARVSGKKVHRHAQLAKSWWHISMTMRRHFPEYKAVRGRRKKPA